MEINKGALKGTKYRVSDLEVIGSDSSRLEVGSVVTLFENDGTSCPYFTDDKGDTRCLRWAGLSEYTEKVAPIAPPRFLLFYQKGKNCSEPFATEKAVRSRITEIAGSADLRRDSILVHEIKSTRRVVLGTSIKFIK